MHRRALDGISLAAAHLKAAFSECALDEQAGRLDGEWLQEVNATQRRRRCSSRHLEVAGAWEDDAALHDVVGD